MSPTFRRDISSIFCTRRGSCQHYRVFLTDLCSRWHLHLESISGPGLITERCLSIVLFSPGLPTCLAFQRTLSEGCDSNEQSVQCCFFKKKLYRMWALLSQCLLRLMVKSTVVGVGALYLCFVEFDHVEPSGQMCLQHLFWHFRGGELVPCAPTVRNIR